MKSKLANISQNITLYTSASSLPGTGGVSVAAWEDDDNAGFYPRAVQLLFTNVGAAAVTVGDEDDGAATLICTGITAGPLFRERQVTIGAGESVWCDAPLDAAALGTTWAIRAPLSSASAIALSVVARPIDILEDSPSAAVVAAAVWADATGVAVAARVASILPAYFLDDTVERNSAGLPTSARRRFYASAAHLAAATAGGALTGNEVATQTITWTYSGRLLTAQRGAA